MKKIFLICLSIICAATVYADGYKSCKVAGTTGTVAVSVYEKDTNNGVATVQFSNDTDVPANVSADISFSIPTKKYPIYKSITKRVPAQYELSVDVSCGQEYTKATVESVSGSKCE